MHMSKRFFIKALLGNSFDLHHTPAMKFLCYLIANGSALWARLVNPEMAIQKPALPFLSPHQKH